MRVPQKLRQGAVGFNMTPMIDVVFLLIIFFLVSSHLARQEAQLELPLPLASSGSRAVDEAPRVVINLRSDGKLLYAGRTIEEAELPQRLKSEIEEKGKDVEVRIRSARKAPYRQVEPILLACAESGVWNVTFAVFRPEDVR